MKLSEEAKLYVDLGGVVEVWNSGLSSGSYQPITGKITMPNGTAIALIGGRDNGIHTGYEPTLRVKHLTRTCQGWQPVSSYRLIKERATAVTYVVWGFSASTALGSIRSIEQLTGVRGSQEYSSFDEFEFPPHSRMIIEWSNESLSHHHFIEGRVLLQEACEVQEETSCPELA
ncbi:MAG: hypothetical protein AN484_06995 [Aphanizomenon flos-aquae WA102]|uniref:Uncharacterized protein n=1 Tax=Aphanizomenon flos-aquae WA102 TaxID=1710896 RepID=A0A1B7X4Y2_APHFL|nr:MAG: hypothetical protein AN484_06995 [Aphanizomenon flos-aquae WA102]